MLKDVRELWRFRELLFSLVERELRIRYKNSFLGFFWSLLNPLIVVLVMTLVFRNYLRHDVPNLSAYILAAYLPFVFFQMSLMDSAQSVLAALPIIKKVYFPREVLPLAMILSNFVHLLLALVVFFAYLVAVWLLNPGIPPFQASSLLLPVVLIVNLCLATGLGLVVSALNTFFEDVKYIVNVLMFLMLFLCPVMYFSENVYAHSMARGDGGLTYTLYHLNPLATIVTSYRKLLLAPQPVDGIPPLPFDWALFGTAAGVSVATLILGYAAFNRLKWKFVERP